MREIKKRSPTSGLGVRISVWIRVIVIVDPLQRNTLLHTMHGFTTTIDYWLQRAELLSWLGIAQPKLNLGNLSKLQQSNFGFELVK